MTKRIEMEIKTIISKGTGINVNDIEIFGTACRSFVHYGNKEERKVNAFKLENNQRWLLGARADEEFEIMKSFA